MAQFRINFIFLNGSNKAVENVYCKPFKDKIIVADTLRDAVVKCCKIKGLVDALILERLCEIDTKRDRVRMVDVDDFIEDQVRLDEVEFHLQTLLSLSPYFSPIPLPSQKDDY